MNPADQETVARMREEDGERSVHWGHWGLTFSRGKRPIAQLAFGVGSAGPVDGTVGSPERERYQQIARAWVSAGTLPEGATRQP